MSHQEKQRIFDQYAKSQEYLGWEDLYNNSNDYKLINHVFSACDLVQEEQQERIAENVSTKTVYTANGPVKAVNKASIIDPENLIK
ncbi:hypothetical protein [Chryseobacterium sp. WLY505]|uniref:hypothetical protein n=1 Tax=Chryseobacterium sp. WLY505 TaxID=3068892 RepID=UPI00279646E7|nr:hypothetical protein [Chryseobacterium sp. WLY505]MDQ1859280.1 hypothetical protein [Chryseobacterium sp. WLY505]